MSQFQFRVIASLHPPPYDEREMKTDACLRSDDLKHVENFLGYTRGHVDNPNSQYWRNHLAVYRGDRLIQHFPPPGSEGSASRAPEESAG
jgi:hypothetical protein